jgi:anti-sigma B factor antagonist
LIFQGRKQLLLNLGGVSYVDSSGLGALVAASLTAKNNGGDIRLVNLTKRLHDLLVISKLVNVFETFDSEADAVRSFSAQPPA